jgi:hypothetical protein
MREIPRAEKKWEEDGECDMGRSSAQGKKKQKNEAKNGNKNVKGNQVG